MCRVARDKNRLLAVGHQRHYSVLYDNANFLVREGHLGEIRHIRALTTFDHLYIGGGNARKVHLDLDPDVSLIDNEAGLRGGAVLWRD